ncbi:MAG: hypothetical protein NTW21_25065 [Verrucomicrobia bacterium]|nr:hypothetical protein [Verrucomicrobiota bacterium]
MTYATKQLTEALQELERTRHFTSKRRPEPSAQLIPIESLLVLR